MKTINCFRLESISDIGTNGLVARFSSKPTKEECKILASGYGPCLVEETILIYENALEFAPQLIDVQAKVDALAKLTDYERYILGLSKPTR